MDEANQWQTAGFISPIEAKNWKDAGYGPLDSRQWKTAGFLTADMATPWRVASFSANAARDWTKVGVGTNRAKEWRACEFTPPEAVEWPSFGFREPTEAARWKRTGFSAADASSWVKPGFDDPATAKQWADIGVLPSDADRLRGVSLTPSQATDWQHNSFSVAETLVWVDTAQKRSIPLTPPVARVYSDQGFSASESIEWLAVDLDPISAKEWRKKGMSPDAANVWHQNYFAPEVAAAWTGLKIEIDTAKELTGVGVTPADCQAFLDKGISLEEAIRWLQHKVFIADWERKWGTFETWSSRPSNRSVLKTIRDLVVLEERIPLARAKYEAEKSQNDSKVIEPMIWREGIFPEVTGPFMYVKILDQSDGEALFEANDGLFVLRLSPGDSFRAYPGQLVNMTMHNTGERMLMTTGRNLPVFLSGSSPSKMRSTPGFTPNRSVERKLLAASEKASIEYGKAIDRVTSTKPGAESSPDESIHLKVSPPGVDIVLELTADDRHITGVQIRDAVVDVTVFCASEQNSCPKDATLIDMGTTLSGMK